MKYASPNLHLSMEILSLQPVYVGKRFLVTVAIMYALEKSQSIKSCQISYWVIQSIHGRKSVLAVYTFSYKKGTKPFLLRNSNVTSWSFLAAVDR
jgi:hypothetical protein